MTNTLIKPIRFLGLLLLIGSFGGMYKYYEKIHKSGTVVTTSDVQLSREVPQSTKTYGPNLREVKSYQVVFIPVRLTRQMGVLKFRLEIEGPKLLNRLGKDEHPDVTFTIGDLRNGMGVRIEPKNFLDQGFNTKAKFGDRETSHELGWAKMPGDSLYSVAVNLFALSLDGRQFRLVVIQGAKKYDPKYLLMLGAAFAVGLGILLATRKHVYT